MIFVIISFFFWINNLILPYVITVAEKRYYIVNVFCWFTAPKIDFRNDELNTTTMTNYESKPIQNNLLYLGHIFDNYRVFAILYGFTYCRMNEKIFSISRVIVRVVDCTPLHESLAGSLIVGMIHKVITIGEIQPMANVDTLDHEGTVFTIQSVAKSTQNIGTILLMVFTDAL